ncbi:MAG: aminofutalosine synthase MqnE [Chloroflexaceae bacterium]|nr:aminofutalosine synthase MqnE [Chloroflexaceae bacterium]
MNQLLAHSDLAPIAEKIQAGERLSFEDGMQLYASQNLMAVGYLANTVNRRLNGDRVYFVQNRHLNPTNICAFHCNFCSFRRNGDETDAYILSVDDIVERAAQTYTERTSEFHIVGGLHPDLQLDYYCNMLRALKQAFPQVRLKAFTAVEIDYLARICGVDWQTVLQALSEAGLDAMPGGGAEIFHSRVRRKICPEKVDGDGWLAIHGIAHGLGIRTNATMLYGHIEHDSDRVDHLLRLREQQDKTGGFMTFVPLAYHPENNNLGRMRKLDFTTGFEDLRNLAISRILLDNFAHIKGYWVMITPALAQLSLSFGVSDIDGTVIEERIYHDAGARTDQGLTRRDLIHLIRAAGKTPIERDALYSEVEAVA